MVSVLEPQQLSCRDGGARRQPWARVPWAAEAPGAALAQELGAWGRSPPEENTNARELLLLTPSTQLPWPT